ncbi:hypothetical protein BDDG_03531 [Blastomyces dermatitidis ATCC 18188]|uniref:Uncharacterized protein n=2 Tax=Ajellomyces dermatitidis (strain ATCC 18188 / CBS 674.68) TaxID=653446 RepID=F2TBK3_AJEDA|nr:hypothetical protein BDDG_03531 [Blastomyces dermatitidis ATCC 18188]
MLEDMSLFGQPGIPLLGEHLELMQQDDSTFLELALDPDVLSSECRTDTFHTESSSKSVTPAFFEQKSYSSPADDVNASPVTPWNSSPTQIYPPATNSDTQELYDALNFSEWCHDITNYASPCPDPLGETSWGQGVLDTGPLGSLSRFMPSSPSRIRSSVPLPSFDKDSPPDLSQIDFEKLIDSHELLPDLTLTPGASHQAEQNFENKRERSDSCLANPTFKPPRKKKSVLVREYNLRKLPSRMLKDPAIQDKGSKNIRRHLSS